MTLTTLMSLMTLAKIFLTFQKFARSDNELKNYNSFKSCFKFSIHVMYHFPETEIHTSIFHFFMILTSTSSFEQQNGATSSELSDTFLRKSKIRTNHHIPLGDELCINSINTLGEHCAWWAEKSSEPPESCYAQTYF